MRLCSIVVAVLLATPVWAQDVASARYEQPTTRYPHGVLGDTIEHGALVMQTTGGKAFRVTLPTSRVFEDTEPRLFDVDQDGDREVIVVESDASLGARLSIYDPTGLVASNDFIGQSNRWLAPTGVGAADLDGDGVIELAFVDRPHLAKTLRIYEYRDGELVLEGSLKGVTNHRIGERDIAGGIRDCGDGPEVIVANAAWSDVLAIHWDGENFTTTRLAAQRGRSDFNAAMACKN